MVRITLKIIIYFLLLNLVIIVPMGLFETLKGYSSRNSYIAYTSLDSYDNSWVNYSLKDFKLKNTGTRPIIILDNNMKFVETFRSIFDSNYNEHTTLGVAYSFLNICVILLNSKELHSKEYFKNTLIHEYLHCNFYNHSVDKTDIMYPNLQTSSSIYKRSINNYTKDLNRWK